MFHRGGLFPSSDTASASVSGMASAAIIVIESYTRSAVTATGSGRVEEIRGLAPIV